VTTSRRRDAKSKRHGVPVPPGSSETRTFPFSGIEDAGDVRLSALKIRRFEILEEIGRGGHGVVFRANDRTLKRLVALKTPRPELLHSKEMRRRFVGEAQVVAALDHPNIIKVYDAGFESTVCYIAQELCHGPSLAVWLREQTTPIRPIVAASVTLALARGLEHAHHRGVLHRDLKPANVLLKPRTSENADDGSALVDDPTSTAISKLFPYTPKLGDFGICKAFGADPDQTGTRTGLVLGTAAYMAPEQAVGVASEMAPQSDVYSLGAILYEMLTGHPPFEGLSSADVLKRVLIEPPAPIRATRRDVPPALEAICLKCLEKSTTDRYASASELAEDLRRFLIGEPVQAPRHGWLGSFWTTKGRRRRSIWISLGVAGWILALIGIAWQWLVPKTGADVSLRATAGDSEAAISTDVRSAFNLWHENAERLRDNPNVAEEMTTFLARHVPKPGEVDRRGFDWHYAWRLCHPAEAVGQLTKVASFQAHVGDVYFVTFSHDGNLFATAGQDKTARVWNVRTTQPVCVCKGHTNEVNWVDFSPDQRLLATASDDHNVKVWDAATGKELFTLTGHQASVVAVRFNPTGDMLVSGDHEGVIKLWDVATRKMLRSEIGHHGKRIQSLAWGMSGRLLASVGDDRTIRLWEMPGLTLHSKRETAQSMCEAFNPAENLIAYGGSGTIRIDDVHSGGCYATISDHVGYIESIAFSPNGRQLASCDARGELRLWDVASRQGWSVAPVRYDPVKKTVSGDPIGIALWCVTYSPDGNLLATSAKDGTIDFWDTSVTPQWGMIAKNDSGQQTFPLAYSPGSKRLAVARRSTTGTNSKVDRLQIFDVSAAKPKLMRDLPGVCAWAAGFSGDGNDLVVGCPSKVEFFDTKSGQSRLQIPMAANSTATAIEFDGHGTLIVVEQGPNGAVIDLFDSATGQKIRTITDASLASGIHAYGLSLTADGKRAAVCPLACHRIGLCDLSAGTLHPEALGNRQINGAVRFAPAGNVLAIAVVGGVELWDTKTCKELAFLSGLGAANGPLAFSSDGRLLIVVSQEQGTVHLWDVRRGERLFTLPLPSDPGVRGGDWHLAVAPDGKQIACSAWSPQELGGFYLYSASESAPATREDASLVLGEFSTTGQK
jgi:WD40 repeat protein/serine/threonine protein kinase